MLGFVLLVLLNPSASLGGMKAMLTTGFSSMDKLGKVLSGSAVDDVRPVRRLCLQDRPVQHRRFRSVHPVHFSRCCVRHSVPDAVYVCLLAGAVGGAIWGVFRACSRAYFNVNEVITAIMFNWIGMYLVELLLAGEYAQYAGLAGARPTRTVPPR